jgi:hypothetical protein
MAGGRGLRIGIALGEGTAVAVVLGRRGAPTAACSGAFESDGTQLEAELRRAFEELKASLEVKGVGPTEGARVHVALLPPLADARVIPFPPMRRGEAEAVLTRDAARYFLGTDRPRVVGVRSPGGGGGTFPGIGDGSVPIFATAASTALLESVRRGVAAVGWRCESTASAHGAWMAAATGDGDGVRSVVAVAGGRVQVLLLRGGHPEAVRQIPLEDMGNVAQVLGPSPGHGPGLSSRARSHPADPHPGGLVRGPGP